MPEPGYFRRMPVAGAPVPKGGPIVPEWQHPGLGLASKEHDADRFGQEAG